MRIIAGKHKGRRINPPMGLPVRPTTDIAKEGLFNVFWTFLDFRELRVLDLFSGTGNISLEFASRECIQIVAVEQNPKCVRFIQTTAESLQMPNLKVIREDCFRFLSRNAVPFDLVFADPPYDLDRIPELPDLVLAKGLKPGGWFVIEHSSSHDFSHHPAFYTKRNYGKVNFTFFQKENPEIVPDPAKEPEPENG